MGFWEKEDVPPAPDMSGIIRNASQVTSTASDMAKQTFDWATNAVAENKASIGKFVDQMTSDSDTARGMIQQFQDISNKQIGLAEGAADIRDAAMTQSTRMNAIGDTQLGIQQRQLSNQDAQLQFQNDLRQIQQDFRGDQQAIQQKTDELYGQYQKTYPAMMEQFAADAAKYDTPERRAQAGAEATAGVGMQFQAARDAATRQLESFGVKPSDTRFAALDLGTRIKEASAKAAADRMAQLQTEQQGFNLRQAAITQGQQLPGQATQMQGQANAAGQLVNAAGQVASGQGNVAANYGSLANQAGANAVSAGTAATGAINAATGATTAGTGALTGATQAQTGALAADTTAANITQGAGDLTNKALATESGTIGTAPQYLAPAVSGVNAQTQATGQDFKNKMDQFKAESTNTSGIGALVGTLAPIAAKAIMTGGSSLPFDLAGTAAKSASNMGDTEFEANIIGAAKGGAIPMSASPTQGAQTDDVKAMLNAGEFIIPKDITSWYGEKFFQNLIAKAQNEKGKAQAKPAVGPMPPGPTAINSDQMGAV